MDKYNQDNLPHLFLIHTLKKKIDNHFELYVY